MPIEIKFDFIDDLNSSFPDDTDDVSQGSSHLRGTKQATKGSFPNLGQAAVTKTAAELNDTITKTELAALYPVGSIFIGGDPTAVLGGTWAALENVMLIGASSTYPAGSTGGSADAVVVSHAHTAGTLSTQVAGEHNHTTPGLGAIGGNQGTPASHITSTDAPDNTGFTFLAGDHSHGVVGLTATEGVSGTNANLPPYFAVTMWQRTA